MITVAILINGQPIVARNAINQVERNEKGETMMVSNMKKQKIRFRGGVTFNLRPEEREFWFRAFKTLKVADELDEVKA